MKVSARKKTQDDTTAEYEAALEKCRTDPYVLRPCIAGNTLRSLIAVGNVKKVCKEYLKGSYEREVIDICQDRTKNLVDPLLAAPTLIRRLPIPLRRIIGTMTRKQKVLAGPDLVVSIVPDPA